MAKKSTAAKADTEESVENTEKKVDVAPVDTTAERKKALEGQVVQDGDYIKVDVLGKTIEEDPANNVVFQASNLEDAKMLLNFDPKNANQYVPDMAIVGKKGFLMDKIDEAVKGMKFFEDKILKLEPKDAFGERDGKKIEMLNAKQFKKDMNEEPRLGASYKDKKGRQGTVIKLAQGRMIVDFNHPLAGKTVEYKIKVVDKIEGFENQVKAFIDRRLPGAMVDLFNITHDKETKTLDVEIPQAYLFQQQLIYFKFGLSMDLQEHVADVGTVRYIEKFEKMPAQMAHDHDHEGHDHEHDHEHEHAAEATEEKKE